MDEELNLGECDYYQGLGTCSFGCRDEPECMTCRPDGGWPVVNRHPVEEANRAARRLGRRVQNWLAWLPFSRHAEPLKRPTPCIGSPYPTTHEVLVALARSKEQP